MNPKNLTDNPTRNTSQEVVVTGSRTKLYLACTTFHPTGASFPVAIDEVLEEDADPKERSAC
jgi:hypothetical protein